MNFSASFVLKTASLLTAFALIAGCGSRSAESVYADGQDAFARRDFAQAVRDFSESVKLCPKNPDTWFMLARAHLALAEIPAARKAVQEAARWASGKENIVDCGEVDIIELAGQLAFYAKDLAAARAAYTALTAETWPNDVRARGFCGLGVIEMSEIVGSTATIHCERARVNLLQAMRLDGNNATVRYHLGRLYRDSYDYKEAARDQFDLFVLLEKTDAERVKTIQTSVLPRLREAIEREAAERLGSVKRDSAACATALKRADDAWRKGQYKTARLRYYDALQADALSFQAAKGLAQSWEKAGATRDNLREALKAYRTAAQLRPSLYDILMKVGDLAAKTGSPATAAEAYSRAVAARPLDISAIDGLIRALQKGGDAKRAAVYQAYRDSLPKRKK